MRRHARAGHRTGHSTDGNTRAASRAALAKLAHPQLPPVYPRTRLFTWLDEAARRAPIIWIEGPPGAGKTTLVASWLAARRRSALWFRVDAGDRDVAAFFHYLGLAGLRAAPRYRAPLPKLTPEYLTGLPIFARNFFRELGRRLRPPFVLVLDNLHDVAADAGLYEVLREGLDELPPRTGAVLVSREAPPPAFARWQLEQRLRLLDWEALRLREQEAAELVQFLEGVQQAVAAEDVQRLHEQCDGWLAGLLLLRARGAMDARRAPPDASPTQRLFDYFAGEVFDRRHPAVKEFLMQTALFPSFTAMMAEKLTRNAHARALLEDLTRQHHFTECRPGTAPIYQYHPLFRAFLQERARATWSAAELERLRHRAAALVEQVGDHEAALQLYLQSGDWNQAARLIRVQAEGLVAAGSFETLRHMIARLPAAALGEEPALLYWRGLCRLPFAPEEARQDLEQAYAASSRRDDAAGLYLSWAAIIDSFFLEWRDFRPADKWIIELQSLRARHPRFPSADVEGRVVTAAVNILNHRYLNHPDLPAWTERGERLLRTTEDDSLRGRLTAALFLHYVWLGRLEKVKKVVDQLRSVIARERAGPVARTQSYALLAIFEWNYGRAEEAQRLVEAGSKLMESYGLLVWKHLVYAQGVYAALVPGDAPRARRYLDLIVTSATREGIEASHYHHLAAMTALHGGDLTAAAEHTEQSLRMAGLHGLPFGHLCCLYLSANIAFFQGRMAAAKENLTTVLSIARQKDSRITACRCRYTDAAIALAEGRRHEGLALLREALAMSRALGGPAVPWLPRGVLADLYAAALAHGIEVEHVKRLIRRLKIAAPERATDLAAWPFPLKVYTLGRSRVLINDQPLTFTTKAQKKPLELLKALIALGGTQVAHEKLAELLWPDAEADAAVHALGSTLYRLRKLIGEGVIMRQEGRVTLDPRQSWVDLWEAERLLTKLEQASAAHQADEVASVIEQTFKLYRGPFLDAEPDAAWALNRRERLRARLLRQLEAGARCLIGHGRHEQAMACYQRALEIDPLAEFLYRGLIETCLAAGRPSEALRTYRRCETVLQREFGVRPARETEVLVRRLQA